MIYYLRAEASPHGGGLPSTGAEDPREAPPSTARLPVALLLAIGDSVSESLIITNYYIYLVI